MKRIQTGLGLWAAFWALAPAHAGWVSYLYDQQGMPLPPDQANSSQVRWEFVQGEEAEARYSGVGMLDELPDACTASWIETSAQKDAPAYVITAGHCIRFRDGRALDPEEIAVDFAPYGASGFRLNLFRGPTPRRYRRVPVRRMVYATMKGTDLAIAELGVSSRELEELGFRPLRLAPFPAERGEAVETVGIPLVGIPAADQFLRRSECTVRARRNQAFRIVNMGGKPQEFHWDGLSAVDCPVVGGNSGSPLISLKNGWVFAVMNSASTLDPELARLFPPELLARNANNYAADATRASGCFDARGMFDLELAGCRLEKPCRAGKDTRACAERKCSEGDGRGCRDAGRYARGCELGDGRSCEREATALEVLDPARARALHLRACDHQEQAGCLRAAQGLADDSLAALLLAHACSNEEGRACAHLARLAPPERQADLELRACFFYDGAACLRSACRLRATSEAQMSALLSRACSFGIQEACALRQVCKI